MTTSTVRRHGALGDVRVVRFRMRRGLPGALALLLSQAACYGTLALIALLSAFGIALSPEQTILKSVIVGFALAATASLGFGRRKHGSSLPLAVALCGAVLLATLMIVGVDRLLELLAFALLTGAVLVDLRLRARVGCTAGERDDV